MNQPILQVDDLHVEFRTDDGIVRAVNGVSFDVQAGETLGIVGESGSGKSAIMGLVPTPPGKITQGSVRLAGQELLNNSNKEWSRVRGNDIGMIFQDPMTALNPFLTIAEQLTEVSKLHMGHNNAEAIEHAVEMLDKVGIASAQKRVFDYPHEFSGGMRQRVMIAMARPASPMC
jgi:oligopeptide transport system ATP-binding protein